MSFSRTARAELRLLLVETIDAVHGELECRCHMQQIRSADALARRLPGQLARPLDNLVRKRVPVRLEAPYGRPAAQGVHYLQFAEACNVVVAGSGRYGARVRLYKGMRKLLSA